MVLAWLAIASPAQASFPGANGRLAWEASAGCFDGCYSDLVSVRPDGRGTATILDFVNTNVVSLGPAYSPDGRRIATAFNEGISVASADGRGKWSTLTSSAPYWPPDHEPAWSPDGREIAFVRGLDSRTMASTKTSRVALHKVTRRGRELGQIGPEFRIDAWQDSDIDWSSRGEIVFTGNRPAGGEAKFGLFRMNGSGRDVRRLTKGNDLHPSWSPDGRRLVFTRSKSRRSRRGVIYTVRRDGRQLRRIGLGGAPVWSPDGRRIAFSAEGHIYLMNVDGRNVRRIASGGTDTWQPLRR